VVANFAATIDGVASLASAGVASGGQITGFLAHDRLFMGVLRAAADAVVVGAGTLRAVPRHVWTAEHLYPPAAAEFAELRRRLRKRTAPWTVVVTAAGRVDPNYAPFTSGETRVILATTPQGKRRLARRRWPDPVEILAFPGGRTVSPAHLLTALRRRGVRDRVVVEGGPHLFGSFLEERCVDDLFQTIAPQVAGRDPPRRPGLAAGRPFAPADPRWAALTGVRRAQDFLFLRWKFPKGPPASTGRRPDA
jgi:riboflavin biosynthesis pyrimidine reductase